MFPERNVYEAALQEVIKRIKEGKRGYIESAEARNIWKSTINELAVSSRLNPDGYDGEIFHEEFLRYSFDHFKKMIESRNFIKTRNLLFKGLLFFPFSRFQYPTSMH